MQNEQTLKLYFGKGEYAITSLNIDKFIAACKGYNEQNKWKSYIWDYCGFHFERGQLKRYKDVMAVLSESDDPKAIALVEEMQKLVTKPADTLEIRKRMTAEQKAAKYNETVARLTAAGFSEEEIVKLTRNF